MNRTAFCSATNNTLRAALRRVSTIYFYVDNYFKLQSPANASA